MPKIKTVVYVSAIFIGLMLTLLFNASIVYAVSSFNEKESTLNKESNELGQTLNFDVKKLTLEFLEQVAGVGMYSYNVVSIDWSTGMPEPHHLETVIKVVLSCNNREFEALIILEDGKFWSYGLRGNFWDGELTFYDLRNIVTERIKAYRRLLNASYCDELLRMLPTAMQNQNLTIENENASLKISYKEFMELSYTPKINGYLSDQRFSIYLSKTGLVTHVFDSLTIYYVATTNVSVSKEEAILAATPYAEAYATQHGQTITKINATFAFARDIGGVRGDSFAIYPRWCVRFVFNKVNEENVFGYAVFIWADNGEVYHHDPQGMFYTPDERVVNAYPFYLFAIAFATIALLSVSSVYVKRKAKIRRLTDEHLCKDLLHIACGSSFMLRVYS